MSYRQKIGDIVTIKIQKKSHKGYCLPQWRLKDCRNIWKVTYGKLKYSLDGIQVQVSNIDNDYKLFVKSKYLIKMK